MVLGNVGAILTGRSAPHSLQTAINPKSAIPETVHCGRLQLQLVVLATANSTMKHYFMPLSPSLGGCEIRFQRVDFACLLQLPRKIPLTSRACGNKFNASHPTSNSPCYLNLHGSLPWPYGKNSAHKVDIYVHYSLSQSSSLELTWHILSFGLYVYDQCFGCGHSTSCNPNACICKPECYEILDLWLISNEVCRICNISGSSSLSFPAASGSPL